MTLADEPSAQASQLLREACAEAEQIAGIRRAVLALAATQNASERARADIALAVSEACTNVVRHAYAHSPSPGPLTVEAYYDDGELVVVVTDEGSWKTHHADSHGLGLGLSLMTRLAQRLEISNQSPAGTRVLMSFAMPG